MHIYTVHLEILTSLDFPNPFPNLLSVDSLYHTEFGQEVFSYIQVCRPQDSHFLIPIQVFYCYRQTLERERARQYLTGRVLLSSFTDPTFPCTYTHMAAAACILESVHVHMCAFCVYVCVWHVDKLTGFSPPCVCVCVYIQFVVPYTSHSESDVVVEGMHSLMMIARMIRMMTMRIIHSFTFCHHNLRFRRVALLWNMLALCFISSVCGGVCLHFVSGTLKKA